MLPNQRKQLMIASHLSLMVLICFAASTFAVLGLERLLDFAF
jgi:hypothetical protein